MIKLKYWTKCISFENHQTVRSSDVPRNLLQPPSIPPPHRFAHNLYDIPLLLPKIFLFLNFPSSSNPFLVSPLTPIRPHRPLPPPPPSLWWVPDTKHMKKGSGFFPATEWIWHMMIGGPTAPVSEGGITWVPRLCSWTWEWRWRSWGRVRAWCSWSSQCRSGSAAERPPRRSSNDTDTTVIM